jgi:uncharacterized protein (TIGR00255 family)
MLHSMTGFGRAEATVAGRQVVAEVKSLNGKSFDINTGRLPYMLRAWELEVRSLVSRMLVRGTSDVSISIRLDGSTRGVSINMDLAAAYYKSMQELAKRLNLPEEDMLPTLLRMPEIISAEQEALPEEDWLQVKQVLEDAIGRLIGHRRIEGAALQKDLLERMDAIEAAVARLAPMEPRRMERVRERLQASLQALGAESKDPNRFEQELIYYLEKMDVSEEKTRLAQHIKYFRETVVNEDLSKGKVLGFILQEIGREINTLGAKANDAAIQQTVVGMKDELEKAKEQVLNVL